MKMEMLSHSYEVASAISQGRREYQEDAMVVDFPKGSDLGYVVLADGMGGHAAGDIASKLVVTEVFSDLKLQSGNSAYFEKHISRILHDAVISANDSVREHTIAIPSAKGMGTTLVAPVLVGERLYWISIGDSPLFLMRDGILRRLNENHSMATQIDFMAKSGLITEEDRVNHPDRHCLSSGLVGQKINLIDCPTEPQKLCHEDILIVSSDGLLSLLDTEIADILVKNQHKTCAEIVDALMFELQQLQDPDQDNVSYTVIRFRKAETLPELVKPALPSQNIADTVGDFEPNAANIQITNYVFVGLESMTEAKD